MSLTDQQHETYWEQYFAEMEDDFLNQTQQVENGDLSPLELAVKFAKERADLEAAAKVRKEWQDENLSSILNEAEQYGKDGYHGYRFSNSSKAQYKFSNNPDWVKLKEQQEKIEEQMKTAYQATGKNIVNATFDGEEIPLPVVTYTKPSLKTDKIKK